MVDGLVGGGLFERTALTSAPKNIDGTYSEWGANRGNTAYLYKFETGSVRFLLHMYKASYNVMSTAAHAIGCTITSDSWNTGTVLFDGAYIECKGRDIGLKRSGSDDVAQSSFGRLKMPLNSTYSSGVATVSLPAKDWVLTFRTADSRTSPTLTPSNTFDVVVYRLAFQTL